MGEKYKERNRLRILKNAHQRVWNFIKLDRLEEAKKVSIALTAIIQTWIGGRRYKLKKSK